MGAKQCSGYDRADKDLHHANVKETAFPERLGNTTEDVGCFGYLALVIELVLIGCFCLTDYDFASSTVFDAGTASQFFIGIAIFMLAGYGLQGSWMKAFGMSSFGFALLIIVIALQESILVEGYIVHETLELRLNINDLISASTATVAVLISWGALAGKISPIVMIWVVSCETLIFWINEHFVLKNTFQTVDVAGCISIHVFGAFFGVACSFGHGLTPYTQLHRPVYASDVFANVSVALLWIYFPTFNGSTIPMNTAEQRTAMLNTIFALLGSTAAAFATGPIFNPTGAIFTSQMLRVATLSGGVAISAICNMGMGPGGALIIGFLAGTLSSYFVHLQNDSRRPLIEKLELSDSYGVMFLNGMPGVLGAIVSAVLPLFIADTYIIWTDQLLGLLTTISIASISGFLVGRIAKCRDVFTTPDLDYNDSTYWKTADDIPNFGYYN
mmetsp:Transcript_57346/g.147477  ORF Transcript_57346/g.147477 Transcript_57346/m.147477 type:complete len:443 (+) Transcript_57346:81-1409(+)|eukprot:CAMPEP_0195105320 /NCGR_PEP_ID=MMETSP0448-20130528/75886_1 /TAXON_ID=66468 /ORGANISM="Heterocapsa triquestra, Strain CCMP 448" /LENGTH=442 /DNA_ID=CAMNT_0040141329 /DNA_START=88 /DNA_END=1416 /DNA_ORIENTATION=+